MRIIFDTWVCWDLWSHLCLRLYGAEIAVVMVFGVCLWKTGFPIFFNVVCLFVCISRFSCVGIYFILRQCLLPCPLPKDSSHKAGKSGHSVAKSSPVTALEASTVRLMCQALSKHQRCVYATALAGKDCEINRRMSPAGCGNPFLVLWWVIQTQATYRRTTLLWAYSSRKTRIHYSRQDNRKASTGQGSKSSLLKLQAEIILVFLSRGLSLTLESLIQLHELSSRENLGSFCLFP